MQWLGKRMNGQISIMELAVMVTMGAILALPMQAPDRGLLQGFVALLVKDSVLQLKTLERSNITKQLLFSVLRQKNIYHLGKVKRMYIEGCGSF
ncbi:hypothetical protein EXU57_18840 [Segetibacter sp. 3557_3]|uniref:YetF domain-containing protein n=1 Tax=Segetibacter sp. 3557_3 TaxID=2547429 RepID=UPI001058E14B|nr:YetF domain-containing protein [Segetibacter sp. 3557_3]TDH21567.1 hypothetical protein EXU57_18840 [Segetibacter sp. 3557_3]